MSKYHQEDSKFFNKSFSEVEDYIDGLQSLEKEIKIEGLIPNEKNQKIKRKGLGLK